MANKHSSVKDTTDERPDSRKGNENRRLGANLSRMQYETGWTNEQMAELFNMSTGNYVRIRNGEVALTVPRLDILRYKFDVDLNWLISGDGDPRLAHDDRYRTDTIFEESLNSLIIDVENTRTRSVKDEKLQKILLRVSELLTER